MKTKTLSITILTACLIAVAGLAQAQYSSWSPGDNGGVRFRLGLYEPAADSSYWDEKFDVWTGNAGDFQDFVWGVDGLWMVGPSWGFQMGSSWYQGATTQAYRDWVDDAGRDVTHRTELSTWDLTGAVIFKPLSGSTVRPYIGIGGGLLSWRLLEWGDFIDFGPGGNDSIVPARYGDDGSTFMAFAVAGVEAYVGHAWSFFLDGRWREADTSLGGGFYSLNQRLDLSGGEFSAGISWNF